MSKDTFVIIQSIFSTPESKSTSDFSCYIGIPQEVIAVAIKSVTIPHLHTNINQYNNKLVIFYGASSTATILLPEGQYNIAEFILALRTLIRTATTDNDLEITQDVLSRKLKFTGTEVISFSTDIKVSPLTKIIGAFDKSDATYPVTKSADFTVNGVPNLYGLKNYYVTSRTLSGGYNGLTRNGKQIPLILVVPVEEAYGTISHYEPQSIELDRKVFSSPENIQYIDIQILDDNFNVVDLHGGDVEITLMVFSNLNKL